MKEFWKNLKFVWKYARGEKWRLIGYIFVDIIFIAISIVVPILSAKKIVYLTNNQFTQLFVVALSIFFIEILRNVVNYLGSYCANHIYRETFINFQTDLGKSILKLRNEVIDANSSGVFIQRMTSDTSRLSEIFNMLNGRLSTILTDIGIFVAIFIINKLFFVALLIVVLIRYLIEKKRIDIFVKNNKEFKKKNELITGFVGEIVRGVRDIKMLNAEESFINELHSKVSESNQFRYKMLSTNRRFIFFRGSVQDLSDLLIICLLIYCVVNKYFDIASALVLLNYSGKVHSIVNSFATLLDDIKEFNVSAERVFSIFNGEEFKKEDFGEKTLEHVNGDFEFKNVTFKYDKAKVLDNLSFKVKTNETVAFVGKSGAGKTTIFNLLCKMYEPNKGTITIDGVNIKKLDKDTIRGNITIISQNPYIFNMSIRDNLRLVKEDLTEEDMINACKMACLHDFIMEQPDGYDTMIGEGGLNLSGGQRQRLAIARAFVQKTEIILFDEATSALDNETQANIQKAISNMKGEYTILIIAHRLSTIINSDRILFINEGKVEAEGTHKELLKTSANYKHLYESEIKSRK